MSASTFRSPSRILFGAGSLEALGREVRRLGDRAVLVTGRKAMADAGATGRALASLGAAHVRAAVFNKVEPEPDVATVDHCRTAVRDHHAAVVIGLGGGSAMDVAKVAARLAGEDKPTANFHQGEAITQPGLPCVAVPSTCGTGSEMTHNGVLSDRRRHAKTSIRDEAMLPAVAIIDPEVTLSCPPNVTAASGVDAFVQAVESYVSLHATPITEALSLRAVEELHRALPAVVTHGNDLALRTAAAWGSALAGLALANARLGVVHGLAHPVGVRYHIPHGIVCGALLPAALEFNREAAAEKFAVLERMLGGDIVGYAQGLLVACALPPRLTEFGLAADAFDAIADEALPSGSTEANPRPVTREDLLAMLAAVA